MIKEIKRQRELLKLNNFIDNLHAETRRGVSDYMFNGKRNKYNNYDCIYRHDYTYSSITIYMEKLKLHCSCELDISEIKQCFENKYNHPYKYSVYTAYTPGYD